MTRPAYCDRVTRRDFLKAGALGGLGLGLADWLRLEAQGAVETNARGKNAIFIFLGGGQSHLETFDLKPGSDKVDVDFKPIATNVPGIDVSEMLPRLAKQADKYAIVRSVHHTQSAHIPGQQYLRTGNSPSPSVEYPSYGSIVAKEFTVPAGIPPYVSLPLSLSNGDLGERSGYLGPAYSAFGVVENPNDANFSVRALAAPGGMSREEIDARSALMRKLDTGFRNVDIKSQALDGMDRFYDQAFDILRSDAARQAFDLQSEDARLRERYGRTPFGQACVLARRLVEAGVRFVTIDHGGWDHHQQVISRLKTMLPEFDAALAALFEDLDARGLLENTVVWVTGEFGRGMKINKVAGRDHWPRAMSMLFAGGGVRGGQVIGKTDDQGAEPVESPHSPDDAAASFLHVLGIDPAKEYYTPTSRPVMLVRDGRPIQALYG